MTSPESSPRQHEFDALLEMDGGDNGVFVVVPFSVPDEYGTKGTLPVQGTIDGFPIRLNLTPLEGGDQQLQHMFSVRKEVRNAIGKTWADTVHVVLQHDTDPAGLDLPDDLVRALDRTALRTPVRRPALHPAQAPGPVDRPHQEARSPRPAHLRRIGTSRIRPQDAAVKRHLPPRPPVRLMREASGRGGARRQAVEPGGSLKPT